MSNYRGISNDLLKKINPITTSICNACLFYDYTYCSKVNRYLRTGASNANDLQTPLYFN